MMNMLVSCDNGDLVELTASAKVNGPLQANGLSFGTHYVYARRPGGEWARVERARSMVTASRLISAAPSAVVALCVLGGMQFLGGSHA